MIVWPETLKQRTEVIEKFIRIGLVRCFFYCLIQEIFFLMDEN